MQRIPATHAGLLVIDDSVFAVATRTVRRDTITYQVIRVVFGVFAEGIRDEDLGDLMIRVGAKEPMNLYGGGSSTMLANGILINRPAGGTFQQEIMSAVAIYCNS